MIIKKDSPFLALMRESGAPICREEYLAWNFLGDVPAEIDPEIEAELPDQFRRETLDGPPASDQIS